MAADVAETTRIERPPRGREEVPVQISRLLDAHQIIIGHCRQLARRASELGDDGTNDLVVSDVLRANELQVWFLSEHLVDAPLVHAEEPRARKLANFLFFCVRSHPLVAGPFPLLTTGPIYLATGAVVLRR